MAVALPLSEDLIADANAREAAALDEDYAALKEEAAAQGLGFDAVNSNTFQDQPGQPHSCASGSLSSTDAKVRTQAVEHSIECIEIGRKLGSTDLTVWVGDGTNFPGQQDLGRKAKRLVDLGHHAQGTNIEQIVARLHRFGKLGGFHFNDGKYGDDDLDSGSINPHQLFLIFNELVEAELNPKAGFQPSYMIDQSHNVTDPIESMLSSAEAITQCFAKALHRAYNVDVGPILARARLEAGGAIDVLGTYRQSQWRMRKAQERKPVRLGAAIV